MKLPKIEFTGFRKKRSSDPVEQKKEPEQAKEPERTKAEKEPWDGCGTGTWSNFKRWFYTRFKGYVILREFGTYWDASTEQADIDKCIYDCYITHRLIRKKDLPSEAVHCTGEPYTFSIDRSQIRWGEHDNGFRATDAWLYLKYNGFDDCLTKKWTDIDHLNPKKLMFIMGAVAVGLVVLVLFMRH